jgi:hypothetical protein
MFPRSSTHICLEAYKSTLWYKSQLSHSLTSKCRCDLFLLDACVVNSKVSLFLVDGLGIGEQLHTTILCQQYVVQCDGDIALGEDGQTPHTLSGHIPEDFLDGKNSEMRF